MICTVCHIYAGLFSFIISHVRIYDTHTCILFSDNLIHEKYNIKNPQDFQTNVRYSKCYAIQNEICLSTIGISWDIARREMQYNAKYVCCVCWLSFRNFWSPFEISDKFLSEILHSKLIMYMEYIKILPLNIYVL